VSIRTIETRLRPYEIDNQDVSGLSRDVDDLVVTAHWTFPEFVVITFNKRSITVDGPSLKRAVDNAMNHR
jgi:hypothetical protein